jgi:hypothetical protein
MTFVIDESNTHVSLQDQDDKGEEVSVPWEDDE